MDPTWRRVFREVTEGGGKRGVVDNPVKVAPAIRRESDLRSGPGSLSHRIEGASFKPDLGGHTRADFPFRWRAGVVAPEAMCKTACIVEGATPPDLLHGHLSLVQQQAGRLLHLNRKNEVFRCRSVCGKEPSAECLCAHIHLCGYALNGNLPRCKSFNYKVLRIPKETVSFFLRFLCSLLAGAQQSNHSTQPIVFFLEHSELFLMHSFRPAQHPPCPQKCNQK